MRALSWWLVMAALSTFVATAAETRAATWNVPFEHGHRAGLQPDPTRLELAADAGPSAIYPFPRSGQFQATPWTLAAAPAAVTVNMQALQPQGTLVRLHLRIRVGSRWQPWDEVEAGAPLKLTRPASAVELRVVLLSTNHLSPVVTGVSVVPEGELFAASAIAAAPTYRIYATREGLVGRRTANGHRIVTRDQFVALPSWRVLNDRGEYDYQVRITYKGRSAVLPVWDVGPWNTRDDYWSARREMWRDLPRGMPQAQAAFQLGYNRGRDQFGRRPNLPNGLDIADGAFWDKLGLRDHTWVDVTFLWEEDPAVGRTAGSTTSPVAQMTRVVRLRPGQYFMRWAGSGGAVRFDVQVQLTPGAPWVTWVAGERALEGLYKSGADYPAPAFRVRGYDAAGNVGDYSAPLQLAPQ